MINPRSYSRTGTVQSLYPENKLRFMTAKEKAESRTTGRLTCGFRQSATERKHSTAPQRATGALEHRKATERGKSVAAVS